MANQSISASLKTLLLVTLGALWSGTVSVFMGPWLFDYREESLGRPLIYEEAVRIFILTTLALFLVGWFALIIRRLTFGRLLPWLVTVAGCIMILAVCQFDSQNALHTEDSWIRYTTAGFLFLTSILASLVARYYHLNPGSIWQLRWMWWFMAFGFAFLACDELLQIHETLGAIVENRFQLDHIFTDLITFGYATAAILFMVYFLYIALREYVAQHVQFLQLFCFGVLAFFVSQVFDTFDFWAHEKLVRLAVHYSTIPDFFFSDLWYTFWSPRHLLNAVEEVLENLAAILFCVGVLLILLEKNRTGISKIVLLAFPKSAVVLGLILAIGSLATIIFAMSSSRISSPALGVTATQVVGATDGLFHTDGLFFHHKWGLLVANEGKGNILIINEGKVRELPDPNHLLTDTDALTATDEAVYVSSPSQHKVFRYTQDSGWSPFIERENGKAKPEGLVAVGSNLYILDESHHKIYAVDIETRKIAAMRLEDSRWDTPEGIAYHPGLGELLITDDTNGYVIAVKFGLPPRIFVSRRQGLQNPEEIVVANDGRVFLTDNGRREIIEFDHDGRLLRRIRFHRMYGYLTGIAIVPQENAEDLYVVSSDGFGSTSFMPSTIWKIPLSKSPAMSKR